MPRGGSRPGAGRKSKAEKYEGQVAKAEQKAADHLPRAIDNIIALADGGFPRVERRFAAAGTVTVKRVMTRPVRNLVRVEGGYPVYEPLLDADGNPVVEEVTDEKTGKPVYVESPLFPHLPPDEMVEVSRTEATAEPSLAANVDLVNRVWGKPVERQEISGPDGGAIPHSVEAAIDKIYGARTAKGATP